MKYIKTYEDAENKPKVGDYVIMYSTEDFKEYVNTHIGQIIRITYDSHIKNTVQEYKVKYINIPQYIEDAEKEKEDIHYPRTKRETYTWIKNFKPQRLVEFSEDKNKLELILNAKKYNI